MITLLKEVRLLFSSGLKWFKMNVYSAVVCMNVILYIQGSGFFGPFAVNALIHNH